MFNNSTFFIGIDLGDKHYYSTILDQEGELVEESRLPTTRMVFQCKFSSIPTYRIVMEVGAHSYWMSEDLSDEMERRVRQDADKMKLRKRLAEHPFGTIKRHWDQGHFLTRKLPNVRAEMALTILAYNIKRTINILGVQKMIKALV